MRSAGELPLPYMELITRFVEELLSRHGDDVVSVAVFGSVARGGFDDTSDVDVLIVMERLPKSRFKRYELIGDTLDAIEPLRERLARMGVYTGISPVILDLEEAKYFRPLYLDLAYDAIVLYDEKGFLTGILERVRECVEEFGGERVWMGKRWLWRFEKGNPLIELCGVKLVE